MNQPRRILTSALLMGLMLFAPLAQAQNATVKPIVTVAINRLDEIKKDIIYIASVISGQPEQTIAATVELQTGFFTQGLDQTKPIGIIGTASGITPGFYAFVPTKNIQQLLAPLAGFGLQLQDAGDGLLVLQQVDLMFISIKQIRIALSPTHVSPLQNHRKTQLNCLMA